MTNEHINQGFEQQTIQEYRNRINASGVGYVVDTEDENSDEYVHFYFIGTLRGKYNT